MATRTIRISYLDPYATDSSSDEDESEPVYGPKPCKKVVRTVVIPAIPIEVQKPALKEKKPKKKITRKRNPKKRNPKKRDPPVKSKYTGVRQRMWGRWCAEIRDPFLKKRVWLGTFDTAEEGRDAYVARKVEILEKTRRAMDGSPSSVLEVGAESSG